MGRTPWNKDKNVKYSDQGIKNISESNKARMSKEYIVTKPNGEKINIFGLKSFCEQEGLPYKGFVNVLNNKKRISKTYKGYSVERFDK